MTTPPSRLEEIPARLRALRAASGDPSYAEIARRISAQRASKDGTGPGAPVSRATVYDCFRDGRKRFDVELLIAIVRALVGEDDSARAWSAALAALAHRASASALVQVSDTLPPISVPFVGRARELAELTRVARPHWIHAMPGAGKTSLALQAARAACVSGAVGGVIFADLRGHSTVGPPADPVAVTRAALRLLGDKSKTLSASAATRLLRERLRATRTLLVLDDAASTVQVAGIIPHPSGLPVIVTSRVVPDEQKFDAVELTSFAPYESLALLDAIAGRATIEADPAAAEALLDLTQHQPLAVSLTAARVAARDTWTLAEHLDVARARRNSLRLDEPVARSLELTYQQLPESAQRLLRAIAVHPVPLLDLESIGTVADASAVDTEAAVDVLVQHSLLSRLPTGRLRMHELVRVYALDRGLEIDPPSARDLAADRLRTSILDRVWSAHRARSRARKAVGRTVRGPVVERELEASAAEAFFEESLDLLLHLALQTSADTSSTGERVGEAPATVCLIAETLDDTLHRAGRGDDALTLFREALRTARARGDREGVLRAQVDLGATLTLGGRFSDAEAVLANIDRTAPGWAAEAPLVHNALGTSMLMQGRLDAARREFDAGLLSARDCGDLWREGLLWNNIALSHLHEGQLGEARTALLRSIDISAACGDRAAAARGRVNLAKLMHEMGDSAAAEKEAQAALDEMEHLAYIPGVVVAHTNLAAAVCALGRFGEAASIAERGLEVARQAGMRQSELELLSTYGTAQLGAGELAQAQAAFERARDLADAAGDRLTIAGCDEDLGDVALAVGDADRARQFWHSAAAGYTAVGSPDVAGVEAKLATLRLPQETRSR